MKVDIYKSGSSKTWSFLTVPAGSNLNEVGLPRDLPREFNMLSPFGKNVEIVPEQPRAGFNVADMVKQITERGFALHQTDISVQVQERPN